ncbi:MAG: hypothetical protein GY916_03870, partial [Gammaproteobacteria bacterium]|nr:hypothetical protein [Gammaproteobacteria bacterium]
LRQAIIDANASAGTDNIFFDISDALVGGAHTISLLSALPDITETVVIDGTQDSDFSGTPIIVLDGSGTTGSNGLVLSGSNSDGSTIQGLVINNFQGIGIHIDDSDNNVIAGNYIGTDVTGTTDSGNGGDGVQLTNGSSDNTIGGSIDGAGNLISGNDGDGITVSGATTTGNIIQGNLIGTDATGTSKLRNESNGINLDSSFSTTIGGTGTFERNVISGHDSLWADGIYISGGGSHTIQGNYIGLGSDGVTALGNYTNGVAISGSNNNLIGGTATGAGNVIAHNGYYGISIDELAGTGNSILGNRIYGNNDNNNLGIELIAAGPTYGVTNNDADDADTGANNLQNFPVITAAATAGSQIEISGTLDTDGLNQDYRIEFFATGTPDGSGHGEAERYLGFATV